MRRLALLLFVVAALVWAVLIVKAFRNPEAEPQGLTQAEWREEYGAKVEVGGCVLTKKPRPPQ